jgi:hypothetical protein
MARFAASNRKTALDAVIVDDVHAWMDGTADAYDYLSNIRLQNPCAVRFRHAVRAAARFARRSAPSLDFDDLILPNESTFERPPSRNGSVPAGRGVPITFLVDGAGHP